jgi:hypothetical protein
VIHKLAGLSPRDLWSIQSMFLAFADRSAEGFYLRLSPFLAGRGGSIRAMPSAVWLSSWKKKDGVPHRGGAGWPKEANGLVSTNIAKILFIFRFENL